MKAWPTVAGILLLICEQLRTVQPRDFSMKDIILLHPSTTPHPGGFKCFTCEDAADNYQCNRWAPDVFCPKGTKYCYTLHMMDDRGGSVSVTKRCATLENCQLTGCVNVTHNGYQMCTSCCEGNICNIMVPRNDSSAVFSSTSPLVSSGGGLHPPGLLHFIIVVWSCLHWTCWNRTS
ncbi:Ly6/PLAUR domain-containing protein 6 [Oryzias melastigma]|uniref:LY6/PLAUR domain containing 6 n=1 Tax=Oryzias melastigma TaxID=30732 RepID=A0A3B3D237_ORYME|nr:ly6/PLAUR domain-containing protein 6 [Oryzias melastigma]XP_024150238.1 ly6/PLAUR domain-containing protein 6 [Oryzias melastigma]XP_036071488.1 ly6/PLAUR domain-containing protein 6 [Oryzias melastigma]KAF6733339.1 Ly6/PLAUR domain-containing protein 6 [Oryzias melastigma]